MTTQSLPAPLAPNSPRLRQRRWQVDIAASAPSKLDPASTTWIVRRTGRFATESVARRWAEGVRAAGERADLTYFSAIDGWRPHGRDTLVDAGWASPPDTS